MALKTSTKRVMREQEIERLLSTVSDPKQTLCARKGRTWTAEDVAEEVRRGSELGERVIKTLLP